MNTKKVSITLTEFREGIERVKRAVASVKGVKITDEFCVKMLRETFGAKSVDINLDEHTNGSEVIHIDDSICISWSEGVTGYSWNIFGLLYGRDCFNKVASDTANVTVLFAL